MKNKDGKSHGTKIGLLNVGDEVLFQVRDNKPVKAFVRDISEERADAPVAVSLDAIEKCLCDFSKETTHRKGCKAERWLPKQKSKFGNDCGIEGIVWHANNGRMFKIKVKDFEKK